MAKILVLFVNYGPYHIARVNSASKLLQERNDEIIGVELARREIEYAWLADTGSIKFPLISLETRKLLQEVPSSELISRLYQYLKLSNPDIVAISGYSHPVMLSALFWCRWRRKATVLMSESTAGDFPRYFWRELPKSWIVNQFSSALVGGKPQTRYLKSLRFSEKAIFTGYDVVDNNVFHPVADQKSFSPLKQSYFLSINRFVAKKNLQFLLECYAKYCSLSVSRPWDLVLCGDGELRFRIEEHIKVLGLESSVHLPGFLQQDQLIPYFHHAKCFIHASVQEQWGLVVNEAMASGLPVLVSNRCGCFEDLVIEGINGFGFDPEDPDQLVNLMLKISSNNVDLRALGRSALEHIQDYSPSKFAHGLRQAADYALKS